MEKKNELTREQKKALEIDKKKKERKFTTRESIKKGDS